MSAIQNKIRRLMKGVERLNSFENSDQIAKFFRDLGYQGGMNAYGDAQADDCIVARFLKDCMCDPDAHIGVSQWDVTFRWANPRDPNAMKNNLNLSFNSAVEGFVRKWDDNCWPELVETMIEEAKAESELVTADA